MWVASLNKGSPRAWAPYSGSTGAIFDSLSAWE